jgi:hypothetical protein
MSDPTMVERPSPRTREQARRLYSNDKIKNLTKLKVQEYIESFFNKTGANHDLLSSVSPRFIHYNTSRSFDPKTDPTQRQMQIARYFNELRNVIPSILVCDGGINVVSQTIGLVDASITRDGEWSGFYPIVRRIPLQIIAAARDVDEADEMSGIISLMFNEMRNLAGGHFITGKPEEGEKWMIALPNTPVNVGPLTDVEVQGDPIEKIWYTEAELEVMFEDVLVIKKKLPVVTPGGVLVEDPDPRFTIRPEIVCPDTITLNQQIQVGIRNFQDRYRINLSNGRVATLSYNLILTPRRRGKVSIRIYDPAEHDLDKKIITEKEVEVI